MAKHSRRLLWVLTAATLLAAFLRFLHLHTLPPAAWYDEVWNVLRAREIVEGGARPVFYYSTYGGANAGPAYMAALWRFFGFRSITAARLMPALTGVLSIPLAYVCLRELLALDARLKGRHRTVAVLAAVVLSYTLFYVTIARIGMENGVAPPTALFVLWQMLAGFRRRARPHGCLHFLIAGFTIGLAQYNGLHARFILPLLAYVGLELFLASERAHRGQIARQGLYMVVAAVLAALPLILWFASNPEWFLGRASIVTDVGPGLRFETVGDMYRYNARMIARVFFIEGSYDPKNGIPGVPLLDAVDAAGFCLGLAWAVARSVRSPAARIVLVWLVLMTLPSFLTEGAPNLGRMIGIAPPTAALVGVGWAHAFTWIQARRGWGGSLVRPGWALPAAACLLITGSTAYHTYLLFERWPHVPNLREQFTTAPVELAQEAIARAEGGEPTFVGLIPEAAEDIAAFEFLLPGTPVTRLDLRKCLPAPHENDTRVNYLILTGRNEHTLAALDARYRVEREVIDADLFQTTGSLVSIARGAEAPPPPLRVEAQFDSGIHLRGYSRSADTVRAGGSLLLTVYWHMTGDTGEDLTAFAHIGTGLDAQSPLIAQRDGPPCLGFYPTSQWQPGLVIKDGFAVEIPADAPPGEYPIAVGWYAFPSLQRLPLLAADDPLPDDRAIIGTVTITDS